MSRDSEWINDDLYLYKEEGKIYQKRARDRDLIDPGKAILKLYAELPSSGTSAGSGGPNPIF